VVKLKREKFSFITINRPIIQDTGSIHSQVWT
jgi:hypothetical protein